MSMLLAAWLALTPVADQPVQITLKPEQAQTCRAEGGCSLITNAAAEQIAEELEQRALLIQMLQKALEAERSKRCI